MKQPASIFFELFSSRGKLINYPLPLLAKEWGTPYEHILVFVIASFKKVLT